MVVQVEEIKPEGLNLEEPVSEALLTRALSEGHDTGFRAAGPAKLHATFKKLSGAVMLHGEMTAELTAPCKRCLTDVKFNLPVRFDLNLIPAELAKARLGDDGEGDDDEEGAEAGSFDLEDASIDTFDGKKIDLDPIVREQVLLALPMHAVCREDCKGLCGSCGQNLNDKKCGCEQEQAVDLRLAALKNIKLN